MEHGSYLGLGKKICQVLISGEWHILPVSVLKSYERQDELLYRCHSCKKKISLHRASHDGKPAHFEHDPFNKNCVLRFTRNEENRKDRPLTDIKARSKDKKASYDHSDLLAYALEFTDSETIIVDVDDIRGRGSVSETKRQRLIDARCGQGQYRHSLIELWKGCAVTGAQNNSMLRASHIKAWSKCESDKERLDKFNGFLLTPNLDIAFDRHLITFDEDGKIVISRKFTDYGQFGITKKLNIQLYSENLPYLKHHSDEFERKQSL